MIIFASQAKELLGLDIPNEPAALWPKIKAIIANAHTLNPLAVGLSILAIAIILGLRRYRPKWPGLLIAVAVTAALTALFGLDVATIGSRFGGVPSTLPAPHLPAFDLAKMHAVLPDAIAIALLGSIESLLSAVVADGMTGRRHRSNCELVAQGTANIAAVAFGGMCVTGTIARTATNVRAGAIGPVSGILHALYVLLFMAVAAPLARYIPLACLGAVLAVVAWNMAEKEEFAGLLRSSWGDAGILMATFLLTIFEDVTIAIATGVTLGAFQFLHRMAETVEIEAGTPLVVDDVPDANGARPPVYDPQVSPNGDVIVYRISGAFFFGAAAAVGTVLDRIGEHPKVFILDFTDVPLVDSTAAKALERFVHKLTSSGTRVYIAGARRSVIRSLLLAGLRKPVVRYVSSVQDARAHARVAARRPRTIRLGDAAAQVEEQRLADHRLQRVRLKWFADEEGRLGLRTCEQPFRKGGDEDDRHREYLQELVHRIEPGTAVRQLDIRKHQTGARLPHGLDRLPLRSRHPDDAMTETLAPAAPDPSR